MNCVVKPIATEIDSAALRLISRGDNENGSNGERPAAFFEGIDVPAEGATPPQHDADGRGRR